MGGQSTVLREPDHGSPRARPEHSSPKTSPRSPCAPNLLHVLLSRTIGYHNLCSPACSGPDQLQPLNPISRSKAVEIRDNRCPSHWWRHSSNIHQGTVLHSKGWFCILHYVRAGSNLIERKRLGRHSPSM